MAIVSLPPELIVAIAELLDPFTCFDFAVTCKHNWTLCRSILVWQKKLFIENRIVDAQYAHFDELQPILWEKLKETLDDPTIGICIRDISLPSNRSTYLDTQAAHDFQLNDQSPSPPDADVEKYLATIKVIEQRYGPEAALQCGTSRWHEWIMKGASEPIINILVHHTPFLKVLRITDLEICETFLDLVQFVAESYNHPGLASNLPFQHLTTVAMAHWDTEGSFSPLWCQYFCSIPTLRHFVGRAMGGEITPSIHAPQKSNVRELVFQYSRIDPDAIDQILRHTPLLQRFTYEAADAIVAEEVYSTDPNQVWRSLSEHVGSSIEHIVFECWQFDPEDEEGHIGSVSLRDFKKLKTLRCDWRMLWPLGEDNSHDEELPDGQFHAESSESKPEFDLHSLLPSSLEAIDLRGSMTKDEENMLRSIMQVPSESTPLLQRMFVSGSEANFSEMDMLPGVDQNPLIEYLNGQGQN